MAYILDIIIAFVVVVCVIKGIKKGFIRAAFGIVTFLLAAVLSFMFYGPFSEFVINTPTGQNLTQSIESSVYKALAGEKQTDTGIAVESEMLQETTEPDKEAESGKIAGQANTTEDILKSMKIPSFMFETVFEQSDFLMRTARLNAAQAVSSALSRAFIKLVAGIILFLLILIGLWILRIALEAIFKLPLLKDVNKIAGFVAGLINGVLISYLIIAVCVSLSGFNELEFIKTTIEKSYIYNNFYQTNIIAEMFMK